VDKVVNLFNLKPKAGDIGFEIEIEGSKLPVPEADRHWVRIRDGSLQGEDTGEFIFREPLSLKETKEALDRLKVMLNKSRTVVNDSVRAGIHVHLNAQNMNMIQVYNFVVLYLILEEILVTEQTCGEGREGNLFCLRASDAEFLTYYLAEVARDKAWSILKTDDIRYASINLKCLVEMGSVEFRAMRTTTDFDKVYQWILTLHSLRESAKRFDTPEDIVSNFSEAMGPEFIQQVLGDLAKPYLNIPDLGVRIKNGMRNAQDVAFATDWKAYAKKLKAAEESRNPFASSGLIKNAPKRPEAVFFQEGVVDLGAGIRVGRWVNAPVAGRALRVRQEVRMDEAPQWFPDDMNGA
jgi:hypothetical protein